MFGSHLGRGRNRHTKQPPALVERTIYVPIPGQNLNTGAHMHAPPIGGGARAVTACSLGVQ